MRWIFGVAFQSMRTRADIGNEYSRVCAELGQAIHQLDELPKLVDSLKQKIIALKKEHADAPDEAAPVPG